MSFVFELGIILLMLFLNAIFASYEMALASISRSRLQVLLNKKRKGAAEAIFMKDRMEASLAVVQVGITLVGAVAAAFGGAGITEALAPFFIKLGFNKTLADVTALACLIIPLSAFTITFAELVPKVFALNNKEGVCLALSPSMKVLSEIFYPVIAILERVVKAIVQTGQKHSRMKKSDEVGLHELNAAVSLARASRLIGAREEKIVLAAAQLSVRPVKEIMIKAADIFTIPLESTLTEALIRAHLDMHTRFPVCTSGDDPQSIHGYVNFKDITIALKLNPSNPSIKGIVRPIKTVVDTMPINQVLETMIQERLHIALVNDKDLKVVGMVTLEDIIEELVGEIEDEFDRVPTYIHPYGGGWIMGGGVPMSTLCQTVGIHLSSPEEEQLRLYDWVARKVGHNLHGGEVVESDGLHVIIRKLRRKKVGEAIVTLLKT